MALKVTVPRSTRGYPQLFAPQAEEATEWQATTSESVKLAPIDDAQDGSEEAEIGWVFTEGTLPPGCWPLATGHRS